MFQLEVDGLEGWVPIRTDIHGRKLVKDLRSRIPQQDKSTFPLLANLAASVLAREKANGAPPLLALWARIEDPTEIAPVCIAQLHMVPADTDATPESFAADLVGGLPLHRPYEISRLDTASGRPTGSRRSSTSARTGSPAASTASTATTRSSGSGPRPRRAWSSRARPRTWSADRRPEPSWRSSPPACVGPEADLRCTPTSSRCPLRG